MVHSTVYAYVLILCVLCVLCVLIFKPLHTWYSKESNVIEEFFLEPKPRPYAGPIHQNDLIFISIASYRDPECIKTVESLLDNANEPHKLRIVVYEQNDPNDDSIKDKADGLKLRVIQDHY